MLRVLQYLLNSIPDNRPKKPMETESLRKGEILFLKAMEKKYSLWQKEVIEWKDFVEVWKEVYQNGNNNAKNNNGN